MQHVVQGGHGDDGAVRSGLVQGRGVGVGRVCQVLAGVVAVAGRELVAGCCVDNDALVLQVFEDACVQRVGCVIHAGGLAKRQVHDIGMQDRHVVKSGDNRGVRDTTAITLNLGDDDLGVRGNTHNLVGVGRGNTRHMRAVWVRR